MANTFITFLEKASNDLQSDNEVMIVKGIIDNMETIYSLNIERLAEISFSSPTTIIRFVQRLGFKSYTDFRERMSSSFQKLQVPSMVNRYTEYLDYTINDIEEIYLRHIQVLDDTYSNFDKDSLIKVIDLISNSNGVLITGDYHSMEIFYLFMITLQMYGIPCYMLKQEKILNEFLNLHIENIIKLDIDANNYQIRVLTDELLNMDLTIKLGTIHNNFYTSLQYLGEIIVYIVSHQLMEVNREK